MTQPSPEATARLVTLIEVNALRGKGTEESPFRRVLLYFTEDGRFVAERDEEPS